MALCLMDQQRFSEAVSQFEYLVKKMPQTFDIHLHYALALEGQGKKEEAAEAFREALKLQPGNLLAEAGLRRVSKRVSR